MEIIVEVYEVVRNKTDKQFTFYQVSPSGNILENYNIQ